MSWNPFEDRRAGILIVLALLCLGFVVGAEWWRWHSAPDSRSGLLTAGTRIDGSGPPSMPYTSDADPPEPVDPTDITYEDFLSALTRHKNDPAARAFAAEFMKDPELRAAWAQVPHAADPESLKKLLDKVRGSKKFSALVDRFKDDIGFKALAHQLMRDPTIAALIREDKAQSSSPASARGGAARAFDPTRLRGVPAVGKAVDVHGGKGAHLFTYMSRAEWQKIAASLDQGRDVDAACEEAGIQSACRKAATLCSQDASCRRSLPKPPEDRPTGPWQPDPRDAPPPPPSIGRSDGAAFTGGGMSFRGGSASSPPPPPPAYSPPYSPPSYNPPPYNPPPSYTPPSPQPPAPPQSAPPVITTVSKTSTTTGTGTKNPPPPPPPNRCSCDCSRMTAQQCQACRIGCMN